MEITCENSGAHAVIRIKGRLDAATSPEAEKKILEMIEANAKILVNLEAVEYLSSAGLRILLVAAKKMRAKSGKIVLCSLSKPVKELFNLTGFFDLFTITETEAEAAKSLEGLESPV